MAETADIEAGRTRGRPELGRFPPVRVDRTIRDGEELRLGPLYMRAILTPGHTRGCTSWLLNTPAKKVLFACSLTVAGQDLISDPTYPRAAADFRQTFRKLRSVKADVFLNFHPDFFALDRKRAEQLAGKSDAFVDPYELGQQIVRAEHGFEEELEKVSGRARRRSGEPNRKPHPKIFFVRSAGVVGAGDAVAGLCNGRTPISRGMHAPIAR